jgi:sterol desaturase/sphingolipid hydroxylase (fatty acid hydroxylase superfamily)
MTPADLQSPQPTTARPFRWLTGILTGVLLAILVIGAALWAFTGFGLFEFGRMLRGGQVHISVDQPTLIVQRC